MECCNIIPFLIALMIGFFIGELTKDKIFKRWKEK